MRALKILQIRGPMPVGKTRRVSALEVGCRLFVGATDEDFCKLHYGLVSD